MENLFLAGGRGFIGRHLQAGLSDRYRFYAPLHDELELVDGDQVHQYFSANKDIAYVINAASKGVRKNHSHESEQACFYENIRLFQNIYEASRQAKKFIQLGSGAEYAKPFCKADMLECDAGQRLPTDAYGLSKFFIGQFLESQKPGRVLNLRLFGVFGPHEDYETRFISNAIVRSLFDLPIVVNQNALFDYVYIDDFIKILTLFIENEAEFVSYNITTGQPYTLVALAKIVHMLTSSRHEIIVKNADIKETYTGSNTRLKNFLPETFSFTPIENAISELISWYRNNLKAEEYQRFHEFAE